MRLDPGVGSESRESHRIRTAAYILLVPVLTLLVSCEQGRSESGEAPFLDHAPFRPTILHGELLSNAVALGEPRAMALSHGGKVLWVADGMADPGLHALDVGTGDLIVSLGRRGEGPGEFSDAPTDLLVNPADSLAVWAWDLQLQRLSRFEPRSTVEYEVSTVPFHNNPRLFRLVWVSPDRVVGQSPSSSARFSVFSPTGDRLAMAPGTLLGSGNIPEPSRMSATNSALRICSWPGQGFVLVYVSVGRIEMYDTAASLLRTADVPFPSDIGWEVGPDGTGRLVLPRRMYSACSVSRGHLFALFSGRLRAGHPQYDGEARFAADMLHVFDWNGRLERVYRLDRDVNDIVVDADRGVLYAASMTDAAVYVFSLPPIG